MVHGLGAGHTLDHIGAVAVIMDSIWLGAILLRCQSGEQLHSRHVVLALGHSHPDNYSLIPGELATLKEECTADRKVLFL